MLSIASILAGIPQGSISSTFLYNLYTVHQPITQYASVGEFAEMKLSIFLKMVYIL